jgi:hypothetical protein
MKRISVPIVEDDATVEVGPEPLELRTLLPVESTGIGNPMVLGIPERPEAHLHDIVDTEHAVGGESAV